MIKIAPSILSLDYTCFSEQVDLINKNCEWIHFDVMDGHFVKNISFGPDILKAFVKASPLYKDVHLMVTDPEHYAPIFIESGAENITFHYEAVPEYEKQLALINKIHSLGAKAGISIKPGSKAEQLNEILPFVDLVLVMSVEPGFGGQTFLTSAYEKVAYLHKKRNEENLSYLIEVDGGVNNENASRLIEIGCDILVAGSFLFKGDFVEKVQSLRK